MKIFARRLRALLLTAAVLAVCCVGCGVGDNPGNTGGDNPGGNNAGGGGGGGVVCAAGEAWVRCEEVGCDARITKQNGEGIVAYKDEDGNWYIDDYLTGTYSVKGDQVTVVYAGGAKTETIRFSISGDTLTLSPGERAITYTKKKGINPIRGYTLTVTAGDGGTVERAPNKTTYGVGAQVSVTAIPNNGYEFVGWSGGGISSANNPIIVIMNGDVTLAADFKDTREACAEDPVIRLVGPASVELQNNDLGEYRKWMHMDDEPWSNLIAWNTADVKNVSARLTDGSGETVTVPSGQLPPIGSYIIVYTVEKDSCDGRLPVGIITRALTVVAAFDVATPVIQLLGGAVVEIVEGTSYNDAGVRVTVRNVDRTAETLDSVVVTGAANYRLKLSDKPIDLAEIAIPSGAVGGQSYTVTYYASYKGADMSAAETVSAVRRVNVTEAPVTPEQPVIVLNKYRHTLNGRTIESPDTALRLGATNASYVEKGVAEIYYMKNGAKVSIDASLASVILPSPFITGQSTPVSRPVTYQLPPGNGYSGAYVTRSVFLIDGNCEDGIIPPTVAKVGPDEIPAGVIWNYAGSWTVTNRDEYGGGNGFKYLIDFDGLDPNNPVARDGGYNLTYIGMGKCGVMSSLTRTITVK